MQQRKEYGIMARRNSRTVESISDRPTSPPPRRKRGVRHSSPVRDHVKEQLRRVSRSIVKPKYREAYKAQGDRNGCGDWLYDTLASIAHDEDGRLDVEAFDAVLLANDVDPTRFRRDEPGWQGRLRMSGRRTLEPIVRERGYLMTPSGKRLRAPKAWIKLT